MIFSHLWSDFSLQWGLLASGQLWAKKFHLGLFCISLTESKLALLTA